MVARGDEGQERNGKDALKTKQRGTDVRRDFKQQQRLMATHSNDERGPAASSFDPNMSMPPPSLTSTSTSNSTSTSAAAQAEAAAASAVSIGERVAVKRRTLSSSAWNRLADGVPHVRQTYNW